MNPSFQTLRATCILTTSNIAIGKSRVKSAVHKTSASTSSEQRRLDILHLLLDLQIIFFLFPFLLGAFYETLVPLGDFSLDLT